MGLSANLMVHFMVYPLPTAQWVPSPQGKRLKPEYHRAAERLTATKSKVVLVQTQSGSTETLPSHPEVEESFKDVTDYDGLLWAYCDRS